jgi:hypothetical protein
VLLMGDFNIEPWESVLDTIWNMPHFNTSIQPQLSR